VDKNIFKLSEAAETLCNLVLEGIKMEY